MGYLLLSGASGLLGAYLMRDLMQRETPLAVLVRGTKMASPQQRVESLMQRWEDQAGHALPRPVVLEGDLSSPELGLSPRERSWAADNCTAFMHNAASLTFQSTGRDQEPWRSNLDGTAHVLAFCQQAGIREFHHVSTAYVCGKRRERIYESELDVGQQHGNDYEISKFEAEKMVREADFFDNPTIYRPGIILGDSQDGYTTTFHGFYVPLKLISTLITKTGNLGVPRKFVQHSIEVAGERLREMMQLNHDDRKNFVPVDWVSEAMAEIYTNRNLHGETYHLTPHEPVPVALFQDVIQEIFLKYTELTSTATQTDVDWSQFERFFIDQMDVYRAYWGDDPVFDSTNTQRALPHLPCPQPDAEMFRVMCEYAIETNFGWPRSPVIRPQRELGEHLQEFRPPASVAPTSRNGTGRVHLGLQVNGQGGGPWELTLEAGRVVKAEPGISDHCTATYYLNSTTFGRLAERETTVDEALATGRVLIEGNGLPLPELARILQDVAELKIHE